MTQGTAYKDVIKRSAGFKGYEARTLKIVKGPLEEIYHLEAYLHEKWAHKKFTPPTKFGGWTECFILDDEIIKSVPNSL